jgi:hypothetical protein
MNALKDLLAARRPGGDVLVLAELFPPNRIRAAWPP